MKTNYSEAWIKFKKYKSAFYVLEMWQTGNIGSHNIRKAQGQPKEGFEHSDSAEVWLAKNIEQLTPLWETFIISKVYSKNQ